MRRWKPGRRSLWAITRRECIFSCAGSCGSRVLNPAGHGELQSNRKRDMLTVRSELDVLMLGCTFPKYTSVTAKKSLRWAPFLGWFSKLAPYPFTAGLTWPSDAFKNRLY